ncbi:MAG: hypothetical protein O6950_04370 [Gammaproteobacteria bacterium]|nr:hypothetical protein [Gammaproteobacteria bacterium]
MCTLSDFENLCRKLGIHILERRAVDHVHKTSLGRRLFPRLLGEIALYCFQRLPLTRWWTRSAITCPVRIWQRKSRIRPLNA